METSNIPGGTLKITLANASQYLIIALFYMIVTKTNALTQTEIGTLSILSFLASTFGPPNHDSITNRPNKIPQLSPTRNRSLKLPPTHALVLQLSICT